MSSASFPPGASLLLRAAGGTALLLCNGDGVSEVTDSAGDGLNAVSTAMWLWCRLFGAAVMHCSGLEEKNHALWNNFPPGLRRLGSRAGIIALLCSLRGPGNILCHSILPCVEAISMMEQVLADKNVLFAARCAVHIPLQCSPFSFFFFFYL